MVKANDSSMVVTDFFSISNPLMIRSLRKIMYHQYPPYLKNLEFVSPNLSQLTLLLCLRSTSSLSPYEVSKFWSTLNA